MLHTGFIHGPYTTSVYSVYKYEALWCIHHRAESFLPPHTYGLHSQLGSILDAGHRFPCIFAGGLISSGTKHILLYSITESKKLTRPLEVANAVQMHARILWGVRGVSFSIAGAIINSLVFVVCVLGGRNYRHTDVLSFPVLVLSCPALSCRVMSCPAVSCHVLSCPVLSCPVLSCPVPFCPVLSCHAMSCPVLSCPV